MQIVDKLAWGNLIAHTNVVRSVNYSLKWHKLKQ